MALSWKTLRGLEEEHGDAFFLVSIERFEENFDRFRGAVRARYPKANLAYSYKTNYLPALGQAVDRRGGYAEVVSRFEYDLARRIGVEPERILFNGPLKTQGDLETALIAGATVNLDGPAEVARVETVARRHPDRNLRVGFRCSLALTGTKPSRFGFDPSHEGLGGAIERLRRLDNCTVAGLHAHSSAIRSVESYAERTDRLLALADAHFDDPPAFLDVGGGFCGRMPPALGNRFGGAPPAYSDYAEAIASRFARRYGATEGPELILEPGVALVGDAMRFVARVEEIRTIGERRLAVCTGSVQNVKPTMHSLDVPLEVVRRPGRAAVDTGPVDVVGYTCMESDVLHHHLEAPCGDGDYLVFENVGAYTLVFKPPFIRPAPPILAAGEGRDRFRVVRRRETLDDVLATYAFDEHAAPQER